MNRRNIANVVSLIVTLGVLYGWWYELAMSCTAGRGCLGAGPFLVIYVLIVISSWLVFIKRKRSIEPSFMKAIKKPIVVSSILMISIYVALLIIRQGNYSGILENYIFLTSPIWLTMVYITIWSLLTSNITSANTWTR